MVFVHDGLSMDYLGLPVNRNLSVMPDDEHNDCVADDLEVMQSPVMETFGDLLADLIVKAKLSKRRFARLVGISHTHINGIIAHTTTPPPDQLDKWADALGLTGPLRERFVRLGKSTRAKGRAENASYVERLERQQHALERDRERAFDMLRALLLVTKALAGALESEGKKIPEHVVQTLASIEESLKGD